MFYPIRTSLSSCIRLHEGNGNNFKLNPQFIITLSKFHGLESEDAQFIITFSKFHGLESEDAYFFIKEFEEVCLMMWIPQLGEDIVRLRFIPFTLKI